jgi:GNAT superfamily N-acetyltransferase
MTEVRIAISSDRDGMTLLLKKMWEENGVASLSVAKMMTALDRGLARDAAIIGVIEENGTIKGSIGLFISSMWYSDDYHIEDLWNFVHPDHRNSSYARDLLQFAKTASEGLATKLLIAVLSNYRTKAKVRLYEREFGDSLGAIFYWPKGADETAPAIIGSA